MQKKLLAILSTPLPLREGLGVVFLFFVCNTCILARGADPFGDVNIYKYQGNMTITAQVQQNGNVVTDAIVAVYCEDELRGKERVGSGTNPSLSYLTVFGEYTGHYDYLHFRVYTNGMTYTVTPTPAIPFTFNGSIGTEFEPYIITLPVSFANSADNSLVLSIYNGQTCDVVLSGRSLTKAGSWNTLCLPFPMTAEQIAASDLSGAVIKELDNTAAGSSLGNDGTLTLKFVTATSIQAGMPYIVRWDNSSGSVSNPVFERVTIASTSPTAVTSYDGTVTFTGTYGPALLPGNVRTNLYMGANNTLYYPNVNSFYVNACRAYFQLAPGVAPEVKAFVIEFDEDDQTTSVNEELRVKNAEGVASGTRERSGNEEFATAAEWFDMQGRRLSGKPARSGICIVNGKKVIVR